MKCFIKKLTPTAKVPTYGRPGDAGLDIYADESHTVLPKQKVITKTGIALKIPQNHVGLVWDRGGMAAKFGMHCIAGVLDETYRGELMIIQVNLSEVPYEIKQGDRIAQLVIQPVSHVAIEEVTDLDETVRGDGRFGSSGR